jgi:hypothetical protein
MSAWKPRGVLPQSANVGIDPWARETDMTTLEFGIMDGFGDVARSMSAAGQLCFAPKAAIVCAALRLLYELLLVKFGSPRG